MPIYAYKCDACGHAKDVLQKMSDAVLTDCPACGASVFKKQLTAAGFQLKGSGWYATDFKGGATPASTSDKSDGGSDSGSGDSKADVKSDTKTDAKTDSKSDTKTETKKDTGTASKSETKSGESKSSDTVSSKSPAASAGGCGASCACH